MLLRENCCWSLLTLKGLMSSHNTTPPLRWSICMTTLKCWRGGGGGHYSIMFYMGRLPSGPIPLPFYTRFLTEKVLLLVYLLLAKWYPVHIPTIKDNQLGSHCSDTCLSLFQCSFVMVFFRGIVQVRGQHWKRQGKGGWAQHFKDIPSIDPSFNVTDCS